MSTSSSNFRLSTLKNKAVTLVHNDVKVAPPVVNVLELFKQNSAARSASSKEWIIDVFPNMTPILMYTMLMSLKHANITQYREHSKPSVATICLYHMTVVYGFFLLNDIYVRPVPSAHARTWIQTSWKHEFVTYLLSLPVPEFLVPILSQFHSFQTYRTKNVFFVPSAAGFDHNQFFGRVYPLNMFAAIQDCTATLSENSTRTQVLQDLYSRVLYTIQDPAFTCLIPDLIGISIDQTTNTTANYMNSKLYQVFTTVLFRDFQCPSSLAALSFQAPQFETNNVNAYDLLFSATSANLRNLKVVLQGISAIFAEHVPCKVSLSTFIAEGSSPTIIKHAYSTYALPTWIHGEEANKPALYQAVTTQHRVSENERAQDICFLQRPTTSTSGFPCHDNNDLVQFNDETCTNPSVLVLDTDGDLTVSAHLPLLAGKIIESYELDGTTIEMPNASKSLGMQNCMFADSAIPYKYVRPGSHYHPRAAGSVLPPLNRVAPNSSPRLPASSLLYDRTRIMLPRFNTAVHEGTIGTALPGMTPLLNVNVVRYSQSFLGFKTVDRSANTATLDAIAGMAEEQLLVWSPYSYTPYESGDYPAPALGDSRHYYLTNLRTIFGTDFNLIQAKHPYESLPVI